MCQDPGERSSVPTRDWVRLACECPRVSCGGMGQQFGLRPNKRKGTQTHPSTKNWIKDLRSMAPPIRIRPSFPHNQSLPSGSFKKPLILIHQRADRIKTKIRKLTNLITWTTALSNSMKLWPMPFRATQDGRVIVENSYKTWSTGERKSKPLQYSSLENPMNSIKRQKDMILKYELSSLVGAQYATGEE